MIAIRRIPEPAGLGTLRTAEIARVEQALAGNPLATPPVAPELLTSDLVGDAYRAYARDLWRMQGRKCCYCESQIQQSFNDVEHYRPKAAVVQARPGKRAPGYWWLAWTWSNLLYACPGCNRTGKNDWFPLAPPVERLVAKQQPPGNENPLLLDPSDSAEDPEAHFRFLSDGPEAGHIVGTTQKGKATVDVCSLHRDELVELRSEVLRNLNKRLDDLQTQLDAGKAQAATAVWQQLLQGEVDPASAYAAMRRARLEAFWRGLPAPQQALLAEPPARVL